MMFVALLGDSILDNAPYVGGGTPVIGHVTAAIPEGSTATLLAVDGSRIENIGEQLSRLPSGVTHLVISVGGNDAIDCIDVFDEPVRLVSEALTALGERRSRFWLAYKEMVQQVSALALPTVLCTIYNPRFDEPGIQGRASTALALFNDCIILEAQERGFPVIDLRRVCTSDDDYANPIEPSDQGGARIAQAISRVVGTHDFSVPHCRLYS